jgi:anaerobic ribonucleoside-triphosphate reductase
MIIFFDSIFSYDQDEKMIEGFKPRNDLQEYHIAGEFHIADNFYSVDLRPYRLWSMAR